MNDKKILPIRAYDHINQSNAFDTFHHLEIFFNRFMFFFEGKTESKATSKESAIWLSCIDNLNQNTTRP